MLNPPLSLLSVELLDVIVEHVAEPPPLFADKIKDKTLDNLSLADRAFTQSCQRYIFRTFKINNRNKMPKKLKMAKKILDDKPSLANQIRTLHLAVSRDAKLFNDPTFISILQLLAESPVPPHDLHFDGHMIRGYGFVIQDPILIVRRLAPSFFSQTLTILRIADVTNVPLPIFLICPRLREVTLTYATAEKSYDEYPDDQCSGREPPSLEVLDYGVSHSLLRQMITPPSRFKTPVVLWSSLRILTVAPYEKEGLDCLQPILDAACDTLEELYLTNFHHHLDAQHPLAGLVNLRKVSRLHVFSLCSIIQCKAPPFAVLHDINIVLRTIPESNKFTNLSFYFTILGRQPFRECLDQDWDGMCNEVIRISDRKPLEVEIQMALSLVGYMELDRPGQVELFKYIMDKAGSLSDYSNICTHFWNPNLYARGLGPVPRGHVRSRCKR